MLTSEFSKTYETKIGNTIYTITSECPRTPKMTCWMRWCGL